MALDLQWILRYDTKIQATKGKKMDFIKTKSFCANVQRHYQESEMITYRIGENIHKSYIL